jgi:hypothetical protein
VIWGASGNTTSTTQGGGILTLTGFYFLEPGQCTVDPVVSFDYGNSVTTNCPLTLPTTSAYSGTGTFMKCSVPAGCGQPKVVVNVCGRIARDLPRFPMDFFFWSGNGLSNGVDYCQLLTSTASGTWAAGQKNYLCGLDFKSKLEQTGAGTGQPIITLGNPATTSQGGTTCIAWTMATTTGPLNRAVAPYAATWNSQNLRLCYPTRSKYALQWSTTGPIAGMGCVPFLPAGDTYWDQSQYQLCSPLNSIYPSPDSSLLYHYAPPTVTRISPPNGPTLGNITITLYGTSFTDASTTSVTVNNNACPVLFANATYITCTLPAGSGTVSIVRVSTCATLGPVFLFSYDGPVIADVQPRNISTTGGTLITITGANFGTSGSAYVSNILCDSTAYTYTFNTIICPATSGMGTNVPITVSSGGRTSTPFYIWYFGPNVTAVSPSTYDTLPGATVFNVTGKYMGTSGSVTVGGAACSLTGSGWSDTLVQCILPPGQGANQAVIVTSGGQTNNPPFLFSYSRPSLTSLTPVGGAAGISVVIRGTSFGLGTDVQVYLNGMSVSVTSTGQKAITFTVPAGFGLGVPLYIVSAGQQSINQLAFSYAPQVTFANTTTGKAPTEGGVALTITGSVERLRSHTLSRFHVH